MGSNPAKAKAQSFRPVFISVRRVSVGSQYHTGRKRLSHQSNGLLTKQVMPDERALAGKIMWTSS